MKAIVCTKYGPPEVLQIKEVEKPTPKHSEVLIKIFATAVTASDCIVRGFKVPISFWLPMGLAVGFTKPRQSILGIVLAGEVESVGKDVKSFKKGGRVPVSNSLPTQYLRHAVCSLHSYCARRCRNNSQ